MQPKLYMLSEKIAHPKKAIWEYDWMPRAWAKKIEMGVSQNRGKKTQNGWFGGTTIFGNTQIIKYNLIAEGWWTVTFLRHQFFPKERFCSQRGGVSFHSKPSRFVTILSNNWNLWSNPTALSLRILTAQKVLSFGESKLLQVQTPPGCKGS